MWECGCGSREIVQLGTWEESDWVQGLSKRERLWEMHAAILSLCRIVASKNHFPKFQLCRRAEISIVTRLLPADSEFVVCFKGEKTFNSYICLNNYLLNFFFSKSTIF